MTMRDADLTYREDGPFTAFLPESAAGEAAWRRMAELTDGTGKVLAIHAEGVLSQLRAAGYVVRKASPVRPLAISDHELLAALGV